MYRNASLEAISMREITLFGEDNAHRQIISALTQRLAA